MVKRIYRRYAEIHSFLIVSGELNEDEIPSQSGGRWHPLTIPRVLINECYTGRTYYRRTKRVMSHNGRNENGPRSQVALRPKEE